MRVRSYGFVMEAVRRATFLGLTQITTGGEYSCFYTHFGPEKPIQRRSRPLESRIHGSFLKVFNKVVKSGSKWEFFFYISASKNQ